MHILKLPDGKNINIERLPPNQIGKMRMHATFSGHVYTLKGTRISSSIVKHTARKLSHIDASHRLFTSHVRALKKLGVLSHTDAFRYITIAHRMAQVAQQRKDAKNMVFKLKHLGIKKTKRMTAQFDKFIEGTTPEQMWKELYT